MQKISGLSAQFAAAVFLAAGAMSLSALGQSANPGQNANRISPAAAVAESYSSTTPHPVPSVPPAVVVDSSNYVLGPEDQIEVRIFGQSEADFPTRPETIANDGKVSLPMVGSVQAGGMTVDQLQGSLAEKYAKYFKQPQVTVNVTDYRSEPVSVAGEVNNPGVVQLRGNRDLLEVIGLAGGTRQDAGDTALVTRLLSEGRIPVGDSFVDPTGKYYIARINMRAVMDGRDPHGNIQIKPHDVITITRAKLVYVLGDVNKPGGYVVSDSETMSVTQALALAGGWDHTASLKGAKILRNQAGGAQRTEIALNVTKIMDNRSPDPQLLPDDILYVPNSLAKQTSVRALETAIEVGSGILIWHAP